MNRQIKDFELYSELSMKRMIEIYLEFIESRTSLYSLYKYAQYLYGEERRDVAMKDDGG